MSARDPLAAARATPGDASGPELERALDVLWQRRALDSQIWVWDYGTQLTDDAEAMGRLGRTLGDAALAPIVAAVHEGTRRIRGTRSVSLPGLAQQDRE